MTLRVKSLLRIRQSKPIHKRLILQCKQRRIWDALDDNTTYLSAERCAKDYLKNPHQIGKKVQDRDARNANLTQVD